MKLLGLVVTVLLAIVSFKQSVAWPVSNPEMLTVSYRYTDSLGVIKIREIQSGPT